MGKGRTVGTDRDRGVKGAPSASIDTHYWAYYGLQLAAGSIPLRRHLGLLGQDFPNRIRYSSSDLKSIRKLCPKDRLPADIWSKLGRLGIRKPCRGKRAGRNRRRYHGSPVSTLSTGLPVAASLPYSGGSQKLFLPDIIYSNVRSIASKMDEL